MQQQVEKLLHFTDAVMKNAARESDELRRQLAEKRTRTLRQVREEAQEAARAYYDREAAKIRAEAGREISKYLMDGKRKIYLRRKEIGQEVFGKVRERIAQYTASAEYPKHLENLLAQAMKPPELPRPAPQTRPPGSADPAPDRTPGPIHPGAGWTAASSPAPASAPDCGPPAVPGARNTAQMPGRIAGTAYPGGTAHPRR